MAFEIVSNEFVSRVATNSAVNPSVLSLPTEPSFTKRTMYFHVAAIAVVVGPTTPLIMQFYVQLFYNGVERSRIPVFVNSANNDPVTIIDLRSPGGFIGHDTITLNVAGPLTGTATEINQKVLQPYKFDAVVDTWNVALAKAANVASYRVWLGVKSETL